MPAFLPAFYLPRRINSSWPASFVRNSIIRDVRLAKNCHHRRHTKQPDLTQHTHTQHTHASRTRTMQCADRVCCVR